MTTTYDFNAAPTIDAIASGEADEYLDALSAAVKARRSHLSNITRAVAAADAMVSIKVNDKVRLTDQVRPIRLQGREATVVQVNRTRFVIVLDEPDTRFSGRVTVPADLIEKV